ncbi:hypothetical protein [Paenibacillus tepidiphilus]|uniref:hypothetical protein n=1 Tax=Paenibacillus tepidiphilus TaxID=2608683 RepID=UPI00193D9901|nr:hypothetical protein [Paenibacillus tepidiphilus]
METKVKQYFKLKAKQKELEQELAILRQEIVAHCQETEQQETVIGSYRVKLVTQQRKEFDDEKLYHALPDPQVWRLLSKTDPAKVAGLIKLNILSEAAIAHTYELKTVTLLHVDKQ